VLAIAYRSRDVPQALMNLILNNEIAGHKHAETTMIYLHGFEPRREGFKSPGQFFLSTRHAPSLCTALCAYLTVDG
jgi:hypothetical protein